MKSRFFILFALCSLTILNAQIGGNGIFRFLNLSPSPVQTALGGKQFVSIPYNVLQNFSNPALISSSQINQIGLNYTSYLTDINYGQVGYVWKIPRIGQLFSGITYLNYGKFVAADENGDITGHFSASETAIQIGYAYPLSAKWQIGTGLKFIHSQLEKYRSQGIASDWAIHYGDEHTEWTLLLRNIGFQLSTFNGTRENLPMELAMSYSRLLEHAPFRFFLTLENLQKPAIAFINPAHAQIDPDGNIQNENIRFYHHLFRHIITGVEIFPRKRFRLRLGFNFRRSAELGLKDINFSSGLTYGFGLRFNTFSLDYAYGQYHFAGNTHQLGIHIFLNHKKTDEQEKS